MNIDKDNNILLSWSEWLAIEKRQRFLDCLYEAGMDNWEGFELAKKLMDKYDS